MRSKWRWFAGGSRPNTGRPDSSQGLAVQLQASSNHMPRASPTRHKTATLGSGGIRDCVVSRRLDLWNDLRGIRRGRARRIPRFGLR